MFDSLIVDHRRFGHLRAIDDSIVGLQPAGAIVPTITASKTAALSARTGRKADFPIASLMILMRVSEEFLQLREATCGYLLCFSSKVVQKISHWARVLCSLLNYSQGTKDQFLVLQASLFFWPNISRQFSSSFRRRTELSTALSLMQLRISCGERRIPPKLIRSKTKYKLFRFSFGSSCWKIVA